MTIQRFSLGVAVGMFTWILATPATVSTQAQTRKLDVSFNNGLVTIVGENVTVRDILAEWGRKGGSRIVNAEKLTGQPLPYIEFRNEPEVVVLRSLLRDAPGYGAAPRVAPTPTASTIDALFILATRTVAVSNAPASSASSPMQTIQQAPSPRQIFSPQDGQMPPPTPDPAPRPVEGSPESQIPPVRQIQGDLPPSVPNGPQPNNPNLRQGPGGTVTSTIPGVVIGGTPPTPPPGRGGRGGGGSLR